MGESNEIEGEMDQNQNRRGGEKYFLTFYFIKLIFKKIIKTNTVIMILKIFIKNQKIYDNHPKS